MGDLEERLFLELVDYLGEDYEPERDETATRICIRRSMASYRTRRNYPESYDKEKISVDMNAHYYCLFDLALNAIEKQGVEFESLHIENNVHRTYQSETEIYKQHGVYPFITLI